MAFKLFSKLLVLALLLLVHADCKWTSSHADGGSPRDELPSCTYEAQGDYGGDVVCVYLRAEDMDLLEQALNEVSQFVDQFGIDIEFSEGDAIPEGVFAGFNISHVVLGNCNFSDIPYEVLSSIQSRMVYLTLTDNNFTSVEAVPTDVLLPFSEYLNELSIESTNLLKIDSAVFEQYTNLQILRLDNNDLVTIGLELLGVETLKEIHYDSNELSGIETGAFRDLKNLQLLSLNDNELSALQEDAFMGLETSPIYEIDLAVNPWNCTCDLQWLKDWLNDRNLTESSGAECAYPTVGTFNDIEFC